jgi:hypothetical protein
MDGRTIPFVVSSAREITHEDMVGEFLQRSLNAARSHYAAANRFDMLSRWSVCLSALGGVVVTCLGAYGLRSDEALGAWFNYAVFAAGALLSLFALAEVVFRWQERAIHHREVGAKYADARRRLELIVSEKPVDRAALREWSDRYTEIGNSARLVPRGIWRKTTGEKWC